MSATNILAAPKRATNKRLHFVANYSQIGNRSNVSHFETLTPLYTMFIYINPLYYLTAITAPLQVFPPRGFVFDLLQVYQLREIDIDTSKPIIYNMYVNIFLLLFDTKIKKLVYT